MCLFNISAKKEGPSFEGGHLSFSCIDSAIVEAQTVTKKVAISKASLRFKKTERGGEALVYSKGHLLDIMALRVGAY